MLADERMHSSWSKKATTIEETDDKTSSWSKSLETRTRSTMTTLLTKLRTRKSSDCASIDFTGLESRNRVVCHWAMRAVGAEAQLVSMWLTREWRSKTSGLYRWSSARLPISSLAQQSSTYSSPRRRNDARKLWTVCIPL